MIKQIVFLTNSLLYFCFILPANATKDSEMNDLTGKFAGTYLCISEATGGVAFNQELNRWVGTAFREEKFFVKIRKGAFTIRTEPSIDHIGTLEKRRNLTYNVELGVFGKKTEKCIYENDLLNTQPPTINKAGILSCREFMTYWDIRLIEGKFKRMHTMGYTQGIKTLQLMTPSISVGHCARISD